MSCALIVCGGVVAGGLVVVGATVVVEATVVEGRVVCTLVLSLSSTSTILVMQPLLNSAAIVMTVSFFMVAFCLGFIRVSMRR